MSEVPGAFRLTPAGEDRFQASSVGDPAVHDVVFGGQILAQMLLAAGWVSAASGATAGVSNAVGKPATSLHALFARSATLTAPLDIEVDVMHDGRTIGSETVTVSQRGRLCARGLVLRHAGEPDLIRHQPTMPDVGDPDQAPTSSQHMLVAPGTELRVVGGVNTWDPEADVGPAELFVWIRFAPSSGGSALSRATEAQAMLAYATDGFLIATSMRPHAGIGQNMAHRSIATGVISHTLTFHDRFDGGEWLLLAHEAPWAGLGRSYGRAHVFTEGGRLVASFVQESLIREVYPPGDPTGEGRAA
ncbi:MAG: acyl-CoA thioesterase [Acidimicrobiales bacterium]